MRPCPRSWRNTSSRRSVSQSNKGGCLELPAFALVAEGDGNSTGGEAPLAQLTREPRTVVVEAAEYSDGNASTPPWRIQLPASWRLGGSSVFPENAVCHAALTSRSVRSCRRLVLVSPDQLDRPGGVLCVEDSGSSY